MAGILPEFGEVSFIGYKAQIAIDVMPAKYPECLKCAISMQWRIFSTKFTVLEHGIYIVVDFTFSSRLSGVSL